MRTKLGDAPKCFWDDWGSWDHKVETSIPGCSFRSVWLWFGERLNWLNKIDGISPCLNYLYFQKSCEPGLKLSFDSKLKVVGSICFLPFFFYFFPCFSKILFKKGLYFTAPLNPLPQLGLIEAIITTEGLFYVWDKLF